MLARIRKTTDQDPTTFDLEAVFARRKAEFGDARMEGGDGGQGGDGGGDGGDGGDGTGSGDGGDGGTGDDGDKGKGGSSGDDGAKFTQADLDRVIRERLADERKRFDRELEAEREKVGKSEAEKAELDRKRAEQERDEARRELVTERVNGKARDAALAKDAKPERVAAILRVADLDGCADDAGNVDEGKVAKAVEKVLAEFPEWKASKKAGKSGGELNGEGKADPTLDDFRKMDYAERTELYKKNPELYSKLSDQLNDEG